MEGFGICSWNLSYVYNCLLWFYQVCSKSKSANFDALECGTRLDLCMPMFKRVSHSSVLSWLFEFKISWNHSLYKYRFSTPYTEHFFIKPFRYNQTTRPIRLNRTPVASSWVYSAFKRRECIKGPAYDVCITQSSFVLLRNKLRRIITLLT